METAWKKKLIRQSPAGPGRWGTQEACESLRFLYQGQKLVFHK